MSKTVQIHIRAKVGRDDDLIAFYRAIPREYRGDVNRAMLSALRRGIEAQETPQNAPQALNSEVFERLQGLPDEARLRSIFEAALAGVVIGVAEKPAADDGEFGAGLLDELTLE